jgi:hypothetical protein
MHDNMIKILELFIKLRTKNLTHKELHIQVKSKNAREIVLKIFYTCYSTEGEHIDKKQKELL